MMKPPKPPDERRVTPEEERLWRTVTRHDRIYEDSADAADKPPESPVPPVLGRAEKAQPPAFAPAGPLPPLQASHYAGLDRRLAERLHKGELAADYTLDWHGKTQAEAYDSLVATIAAMRERGQRVLLVITGKGRSGGGILKTRLPHWLNDPMLRPFILAFARASPKDEGAYRILLKKVKR